MVRFMAIPLLLLMEAAVPLLIVGKGWNYMPLEKTAKQQCDGPNWRSSCGS